MNDELAKLLFPKFDRTRRQKEMRALLLGLGFCLVLCCAMAVGLYLLNRQGQP